MFDHLFVLSHQISYCIVFYALEDFLVVFGGDILHFFNGRSVIELVLHIVVFLCSAFVGGDLNIPTDAPLVTHGIDAFDDLYDIVSLYLYHSVRELKSQDNPDDHCDESTEYCASPVNPLPRTVVKFVFEFET